MSPTTTFSSLKLPTPKLHFDYALRIQASDTAFDGFQRWGPYDKNQPRKAQIRCAIMYPKWAIKEARRLREALQNGMFYFRGFNVFSRGISITAFEEVTFDLEQTLSLANQAATYAQIAKDVASSESWDVVFVVIPHTPRYIVETPYYAAKFTFSAFGIPCQLVTYEMLRSDQMLKWSLANIALQTYVKLGNIPWVVEAPERPNDLIFGVGRREIKASRIGPSKRYMGFTTAYRNNGAFLSFNGISSTSSEDDYSKQLSDAVANALVTYQEMQRKQNLLSGNPDRVIFHSFKKIGAAEIEALETGIKQGSFGGQTLPYVLVHIDSSSSYLVFDSSHKSYLPESGYSVTLGPLQRILLTEGRERFERRKMGFPSPLVVRVDPRSKGNSHELSDLSSSLVEQVYRLSKVNWRGFNSATIPITLGYSQLIADVIASCPDPDLWTRIASAENLRNRAWFL